MTGYPERYKPNVVAEHRITNDSLRSRLGRLWDTGGQTAFLGLVDQGVVSVVRFATTVTIGRLCGAGELGTYTLAFSLMLTALNVQDSLVLGPFIVYGNRMKGARKLAYAGSVLCEAVLLTALAVFVLAGVAFAFHVMSTDVTLGRTLTVLAVVSPFILLHQFGRRFAFAELDMGTAIALDVSSAALQALGILILVVAGVMSATAMYAVVGAACALPGVGWLILRRESFLVHWRGVPADSRKNWRLGRWMLASQLTSTLRCFVGAWILTLLLSVEVAGFYAACVSIVGLTNPILLGLTNVLLPRTTRAFGEGGHAGVRRASRESMLLMVGLTGVLTIVLVIFGQSMLRILYGADYAAYYYVIPLVAAATLINAANMAGDQGLVAIERSDLGFVGAIVGTGVTCLACLLLIPSSGVIGAGCAFLLGNAATATIVITGCEVLTHPARVARGDL